MRMILPPPNFNIIIVSNFSRILQSPQKKSKTMVMQKFWGVHKVYYGLSENGE